MLPLYRLLKDAHCEGKPRPTARDVLEAWSIDKPAEIHKMLTHGFDCYDANGNTKPAGLGLPKSSYIRPCIERKTKNPAIFRIAGFLYCTWGG